MYWKHTFERKMQYIPQRNADEALILKIIKIIY